MTKTTLYIVRHGKTMFNTIERVQGWCDTPLTKQGQEGIHYLGKGLKDVDFSLAYSSDSGRAIETARIILSEHAKGKEIPYFIEDIAHQCEKQGGGNVLVVSHGLTIGFLLNLIDAKQPVRAGLLNGSVTKVTYEDGTFSIAGINDVHYIEQGKTHTKESFL